MARYIDADALIEALSIFNDREHGNKHFIFGIETAKEIVENQPTAFDLERVVQELEELKSEEIQAPSDIMWNNAVNICLKIVKAGGIDERD